MVKGTRRSAPQEEEYYDEDQMIEEDEFEAEPPVRRAAPSRGAGRQVPAGRQAPAGRQTSTGRQAQSHVVKGRGAATPAKNAPKGRGAKPPMPAKSAKPTSSEGLGFTIAIVGAVLGVLGGIAGLLGVLGSLAGVISIVGNVVIILGIVKLKSESGVDSPISRENNAPMKSPGRPVPSGRGKAPAAPASRAISGRGKTQPELEFEEDDDFEEEEISKPTRHAARKRPTPEPELDAEVEDMGGDEEMDDYEEEPAPVHRGASRTQPAKRSATSASPTPTPPKKFAPKYCPDCGASRDGNNGAECLECGFDIRAHKDMDYHPFCMACGSEEVCDCTVRKQP